ncbi:MAG: hypothetical protein KHX45_20220 [Clostridiales bacterium]|nr:hypothetical protein [Clostridiales bacterium]
MLRSILEMVKEELVNYTSSKQMLENKIQKGNKVMKQILKKCSVFIMMGVMAFSLAACGGTKDNTKKQETKVESTASAKKKVENIKKHTEGKKKIKVPAKDKSQSVQGPGAAAQGPGAVAPESKAPETNAPTANAPTNNTPTANAPVTNAPESQPESNGQNKAVEKNEKKQKSDKKIVNEKKKKKTKSKKDVGGKKAADKKETSKRDSENRQ